MRINAAERIAAIRKEVENNRLVLEAKVTKEAAEAARFFCLKYELTEEDLKPAILELVAQVMWKAKERDYLL